MEDVDSEEGTGVRVKFTDVQQMHDSLTNAVLTVEPEERQMFRSTAGLMDNPELLRNFTLQDEDYSDDEDDEPGIDRTPDQNFTIYNGQRFSELVKDMKPVINGDPGVMKKVLSYGSGCYPNPQDTIVLEYRGFFDGEVDPFDSTYNRNGPEKFFAGDASLVRGLRIAVSHMQACERAWILLTPDYAFRQLGSPPRIPPNATLLYDVTLKEIIKEESINSLHHKDDLDNSDRYSMNVAGEAVRRMLIDGNSSYNTADYLAAIKNYKRAMRYLDHVHLQNDEEEEEQTKLYKRCHLNAALVHLKLKEPGRCITECRSAVQKGCITAKTFYLWSKALMMFGDYKEADNKLKKALNLSPGNSDIQQLVKEVKKKLEEGMASEKAMCLKMFGVGNEAQESSKNSDNPVTGPGALTEDYKNLIKEKIQNFASDESVNETKLIFADLSLCHLRFIDETAQKWGFDIDEKRQEPGKLLITFKRRLPQGSL